MKVLNMDVNLNSEFYYNKSHLKIDTFLFKFDSTIIKISAKEIIEKKNSGEIKISNQNLKEFFIVIYKENIINQTFIIKEKEFELPIVAGDYIIEFYEIKEIINKDIIRPKVYKKITIKPNWIEEITL
jgi:hypothetical protein